jgi:hypothetical protein
MVDQCITVTVQVPTNITIQSITIGGADCLTGCILDCDGGCVIPLSVDIIVTFANSGMTGDITPTLTVGGGPAITPVEGTIISVPGGGTAVATFGTNLGVGDNNVCIHY